VEWTARVQDSKQTLALRREKYIPVDSFLDEEGMQSLCERILFGRRAYTHY